MKLHADCAFTTGTRHLRLCDPCQDYAIAGVAGRAYAVVSDGCSTGGRTDIGARLISLAAARALRNGYDGPVQYVIPPVDLHVTDLYATCLMVSVSEDGKTTVRVHGDGVVAFVSENDVAMTKLEWSRNMPCYPTYADDGFQQFVTKQGGPQELAFHVENGDGVRFSCPVSDKLNGHVLSWDPDLRGPLRCVAIFSDGVCQIEGVDWRDAVRDLVAFKSVEGTFVKRRLNRFISPRNPVDDLAVAAIVIDP